MKTWVKYGLILAGIYTFISVMALLIPGEFIIFYIISLSELVPLLDDLFIQGFSKGFKPIAMLILNFFIYFGIGAIIGLILGKIRRNKNENLNQLR
jgi:hypothetical protein